MALQRLHIGLIYMRIIKFLQTVEYGYTQLNTYIYMYICCHNEGGSVYEYTNLMPNMDVLFPATCPSVPDRLHQRASGAFVDFRSRKARRGSGEVMCKLRCGATHINNQYVQ